MFAGKNYTYVYHEEDMILYKSYYGKIQLIDITTSWDYAIENKLIKPNTKGIINDFLDAEMDFESIYDFKKIPEYFHRNLKIFQGIRFAIVTNTPKDVVYPILIKDYDTNYETRPFSTIEGARKWILSI